jgi:hypothetical protein
MGLDEVALNSGVDNGKDRYIRGRTLNILALGWKESRRFIQVAELTGSDKAQVVVPKNEKCHICHICHTITILL